METIEETTQTVLNGRRELAGETSLLIQRLRTLQPDEFVSYDELSRVAGRNVRPGNKGYPYLLTARKCLRRDHSIVIDAVTGKGIKRVADRSLASLGHKFLRHTHRGARTTLEALRTADLAGMSEEEKQTYWSATTQVGLNYHTSNPRHLNKYKELVRERNNELPLGHSLEAFKAITE